jgi:hypothetical protein
VTDPLDVSIVSRIIESGAWCSVQNTFVDTDNLHLYIAANASADLRVYDISTTAKVAAPVQLGTYQPEAGHDRLDGISGFGRRSVGRGRPTVRGHRIAILRADRGSGVFGQLIGIALDLSWPREAATPRMQLALAAPIFA